MTELSQSWEVLIIFEKRFNINAYQTGRLRSDPYIKSRSDSNKKVVDLGTVWM